MDERQTGAPADDAPPTGAASVQGGQELPSTTGDESAAAEIIDLPWDDDLPVALGEETNAADPDDPCSAEPEVVNGGNEAVFQAEDPSEPPGADDARDEDDGADLGELSDEDPVGGRRNSLPRRVDTWRSRTATGAIATAIAMGLQQVFEPERRRPAAVAEAPSDPYDDDDPITVDYVVDDAPATTVHVKPWLLQKGDPT